jgi:hypothetical protein
VPGGPDREGKDEMQVMVVGQLGSEDPITPELALIDPELARVARRQLPDRPTSNSFDPRAARGVRPAAPPVSPILRAGASVHRVDCSPDVLQMSPPASLDTAATPLETPSRRYGLHHRQWTVACLGLVGLGLAVGAAGQRLRTPADDSRVARVADAPEAPASLLAPSKTRARVHPSRGAVPRRGYRDRAAHSPASAGQQRAHSQPPSTRPQVPAQASARTNPQSRTRRRVGSKNPHGGARVFVWVPVRGVKRYVVRFVRSGDKIFQTSTSEPRLVLPQRWRYQGRRYQLLPGRYLWDVRAVSPSGVRVVVRASLVIQ